MFSTYKKEDVVVLLKDITGLVEPLPTEEREVLIQSGVHYSEMLPLEYEPSEKYLRTYYTALQNYSNITAEAVAQLAEKIWSEKGLDTVLVSLARAGTPIGILLKRYLKIKYKAEVAHYTISIIRGKGIDKNAMTYILSKHAATSIQFVDGWVGKGAIQRQLCEAMVDFPEINPGLAVLSDPAYVADKCGTHEDFLIASSCLNSTVSGLLSRTFYRTDIIQQNDYHGALFYENLIEKDLTYEFIETIEKCFPEKLNHKKEVIYSRTGLDEVNEISSRFNISNINLVKPGIGETTRVLLRRIPWKILVHSMNDDRHLGHIYQLAKEKGVEIIEYPLKVYKACGLIKNLSDT